MNDAMNSVATRGYHKRARGLFLILFGILAGCALPAPPVRPAVYDFGPGALSTPAASEVLDSSAMLYRLAYANVQQLKPYALEHAASACARS